VQETRENENLPFKREEKKLAAPSTGNGHGLVARKDYRCEQEESQIAKEKHRRKKPSQRQKGA